MWLFFFFFFDTSYVPHMLTKMKNVIHSDDTPPEKAEINFGYFQVQRRMLCQMNGEEAETPTCAPQATLSRKVQWL